MEGEQRVLIRPRLASISDQLTPGEDAQTAALREARLQAGLAAYERAQADGLCHEGAWECAMEAMRGLIAET